MTPEEKVERILQDKLRFTAGAKLRRRLLARTLDAQRESQKTNPAFLQGAVRRTIMNSHTAKLASVAALVAIAALAISLIPKLTSNAYAIEQTVEALQNVRYMHIIKHDRAGNIEDERWEEIDANGYQARYRQNTPSHSFYVVDDRKTVMVHHAAPEKNTVVLYDPNDQSYTWHYAPGLMSQEIANGQPKYAIVAENVTYRGQPAHHLRTVVGDTDIYIDPETKLPIALGDYEVSYEEPPEGTFDIVIPDGVIVVDKRPGASSGPAPQWMIEEEQQRELGEIAQAHFDNARRALAQGDYERAIPLFAKTLELSNGGRNWASLWMGKALYGAGDYNGAIYQLTKVIEMVAEHGWDIPSYRYARALAYAANGMTDMAGLDFEKILPKMIESLRNPVAARSFNLADDPLIAADGIREGSHEAPAPEQSVVLMINRLRIVSGRRFGYDSNAGVAANEAAIAAWERWLEADGQINITLDAELLPEIPGTGDAQ